MPDLQYVVNALKTDDSITKLHEGTVKDVVDIYVDTVDVTPPPVKRLRYPALFRPGSTEVRKRTRDTYAMILTADDWIVTHDPGNNWKEVKELADLTGATIGIGYNNIAGVIAGKWPGAKLIVFDVEGVNYATESVAQAEVKKGAKMAHDAGLEFMTDPGSPTSDSLNNIKEFCKVTDGIMIQIMGKQKSEKTFIDYAEPRMKMARDTFVAAGKPNAPVMVVPSVSFRGTAYKPPYNSNDQYREPTHVKSLVDALGAKIKLDGLRLFYGIPAEKGDPPLETMWRLEEINRLLWPKVR